MNNRVLLCSVLLVGQLLGFAAHADRSVAIAVDGGKLTLINGSPVAVNYTVECFDKTTGANVITGGANQNLGAKGSIDYVAGGVCASGSPTYTHTSGVIACSGSGSHSVAAANCGSGSPICTLNSLATRGITALGSFPDSYWFNANANPFYSTWDNWGKSQPYASSGGGKTYQMRTYFKFVNQRCANTDQIGNPNAGIGNCSPADTGTTGQGTLCCPSNNGFKSCKVTILTATPANGFLQSPQFKGGASF